MEKSSNAYCRIKQKHQPAGKTGSYLQCSWDLLRGGASWAVDIGGDEICKYNRNYKHNKYIVLTIIFPGSCLPSMKIPVGWLVLRISQKGSVQSISWDIQGSSMLIISNDSSKARISMFSFMLTDLTKNSPRIGSPSAEDIWKESHAKLHRKPTAPALGVLRKSSTATFRQPTYYYELYTLLRNVLITFVSLNIDHSANDTSEHLWIMKRHQRIQCAVSIPLSATNQQYATMVTQRHWHCNRRNHSKVR